MHTILHITTEYPDDINSHKPKVVQGLVQASKSFNHVVMSLNRDSNWRNEREILCHPLYSLSYWGLPFGIGLAYSMGRLANRIEAIIKEEKIRVSAIHAHKISFEGIVGQILSRKLNIPLLCSLRGKTDIKLFHYKRTYRATYRSIISQAERVFIVSCWAVPYLNTLLKIHTPGKNVVLPNIVNLPPQRELKAVGSNRFVSIVNLRKHREKNMRRLIMAFGQAIRKVANITLDIIGHGNDSDIRRINAYIQRTGYPDHFRLLGNLPHAEIFSVLPSYAGLLMPSYHETFGLVYIEALAMGLPILYAKHAGIEGYFDSPEIDIQVNYNLVPEIAAGIVTMHQDQDRFRSNIQELIQCGSLDRFKDRNVAQVYESTLNQVFSSAVVNNAYLGIKA